MSTKSQAPDADAGGSGASEEPEHAILFSGGGANAAYEVGVVKALIREQTAGGGGKPIVPEIYTGTSVGALNAAVMVSEADSSTNSAVEKLERIWLDRIASSSTTSGNGLFRFRFNPFYYLDPRSWLPNPFEPIANMARDSLRLLSTSVQRTAQIFSGGESFEERALRLVDLSGGVDMAPLEALIRSEVDVSKIALSKKKLRVIAANWDRGETDPFDNERIDGEHGYQAILAAAAIPGVVPSQIVDNAPYVDGAVLSDTPLLPAIKAHNPDCGRDLVLHVIYQDQDGAQRRAPSVPNTFSTVYRLYVLAFARSVAADIRSAKRINERLKTIRLNRDYLNELKEAEPEDHDQQTRHELEDLLKDMSQDVSEKVEVTIHCYRPSDSSSGFLGLLDFDKGRISSLIERGYQDARKHKCKDSGCIVLNKRGQTAANS